jgi:ribosomal protein S18 acetylase RimI-like enzyme
MSSSSSSADGSIAVAGIGSPGHATGLEILLLQGSTVERRPGYRVVRTPANPTYHWGNFLLVDGAPEPGSLAGWVSTFRAEHPTAAHVAIAIDDPEPRLDPAEAEELGLAVEHDQTLTASRLSPVEPVAGVDLRAVDPGSDAPWAALVEMELLDFEGGDVAGHRVFLERRYAGHRALSAAGHGSWYAAWVGERPVSTLGLFRLPSGRARYQQVMTDPAYRQRGIAGALLRFAGHDQQAQGAGELVIVADPEGPAIGLYRRAGFVDVAPEWALYAAPPE